MISVIRYSYLFVILQRQSTHFKEEWTFSKPTNFPRSKEFLTIESRKRLYATDYWHISERICRHKKSYESKPEEAI